MSSIEADETQHNYNADPRPTEKELGISQKASFLLTTAESRMATQLRKGGCQRDEMTYL